MDKPDQTHSNKKDDDGCSGSEDDFGFLKVDKSFHSNPNDIGRKTEGASSVADAFPSANNLTAENAQTTSVPANKDECEDIGIQPINPDDAPDSMDKSRDVPVTIPKSELSEAESAELKLPPENKQKTNNADEAGPSTVTNASKKHKMKFNINAHPFITSATQNPPPGYENYHRENPIKLQLNHAHKTNNLTQGIQLTSLNAQSSLQKPLENMPSPLQNIQAPLPKVRPTSPSVPLPIQNIQQPAVQIQEPSEISCLMRRMNDNLRNFNLNRQQSHVTHLHSTHPSMQYNRVRLMNPRNQINNPTQQVVFSRCQQNNTSSVDNYQNRVSRPVQHGSEYNPHLNYAVPIQRNQTTPIAQTLQVGQQNLQADSRLQVSRHNLQSENEAMLAYNNSMSSNGYDMPVLPTLPVYASDGEYSGMLYETMPHCSTHSSSSMSASPAPAPSAHAAAGSSASATAATETASLAPSVFVEDSSSRVPVNPATHHVTTFYKDTPAAQQDLYEVMRRCMWQRRRPHTGSGSAQPSTSFPGSHVKQQPVACEDRVTLMNNLQTSGERSENRRQEPLTSRESGLPPVESALELDEQVTADDIESPEEVSEAMVLSVEEAEVTNDAPGNNPARGNSGTEEDVEPQQEIQEIEENEVNQQQETVSTRQAANNANNEETGLAKYEALNQIILTLLECPVCMEPISPPIEQCNRGHLVCSQCRERLGQCPTCRAPFTTVRNLAMEQVAEKLQYPCRYTSFGCRSVLALSERGLHEASCAHRYYFCPLPQCVQYNAMLYDLIGTHHLIYHPEILIEGEEHTFEVNMRNAQVMDWVMFAYGEIFYIHFVMETSWGLYGCVTYCGPLNYASNFIYVVKICDVPSHRMISFSRCTHNDLETRSFTFQRGDAFFAHIYNVHHFTKRDALNGKKFTVMVSVHRDPTKPLPCHPITNAK